MYSPAMERLASGISGETNSAVEIRVQAFSTPLHGAQECLDALEVQLEQPLGDRILLDEHTDQEVPVLNP